MNDQRFSRLEQQLERLIEGAFAQLFSKTIRPQDIALHLSRAVESGIEMGTDGDSRPIAPDLYRICLNPVVQEHLLHRQPLLDKILSDHIVGLVKQGGYRLVNVPQVQVIADPKLIGSELTVEALHTEQRFSQTARMESISYPPTQSHIPSNPQLIINGQQTVHLNGQIINLGRGRDNEVVLSDPHVSRHHAQLRLRFGSYTLFDTSSQSGTFVNDVQVREHRLQPGDVIRIGKTRLIYLEDTSPTDPDMGGTISMDS